MITVFLLNIFFTDTLTSLKAACYQHFHTVFHILGLLLLKTCSEEKVGFDLELIKLPHKKN